MKTKNNFIMLLSFLFFFSVTLKTDWEKNRHVTTNENVMTILTYEEMSLIQGGACSGTCYDEEATGCGECTAFSIGVCKGSSGSCDEIHEQLECWCDINDYTMTLGCE